MAEHGPIDLIRHRRHDDIGDFGGFGKVRLAHRLVVEIKPRVEQLAHAGFDAIRQLAGDHNQRLFARCHLLPRAYESAIVSLTLPPVQVSLTALADTQDRGAAHHFSLADGCVPTKRAGLPGVVTLRSYLGI